MDTKVIIQILDNYCFLVNQMMGLSNDNQQIQRLTKALLDLVLVITRGHVQDCEK